MSRVALVHEIHPHHEAQPGGEQVARERCGGVFLSRFTQLGLLRLLTNESAMREDVLTQRQAWEAFDVLVADPRNRMIGEPAGIDPAFRQQTAVSWLRRSNGRMGILPRSLRQQEFS